MSESDEKRDSKPKAPGTPAPASTPGSYLAGILNCPEEDDGMSIKICLPTVQDKEHFHRTALDLIEKLSVSHIANDLLCQMPLRTEREQLATLYAELGLVTAHGPCALLQYILDVPCFEACVCDSAPEEQQPLDRCDDPERDRRARELANKIDGSFKLTKSAEEWVSEPHESPLSRQESAKMGKAFRRLRENITEADLLKHARYKAGLR